VKLARLMIVINHTLKYECVQTLKRIMEKNNLNSHFLIENCMNFSNKISLKRIERKIKISIKTIEKE
jgi:hypothetical protein